MTVDEAAELGTKHGLDVVDQIRRNEDQRQTFLDDFDDEDLSIAIATAYIVPTGETDENMDHSDTEAYPKRLKEYGWSHINAYRDSFTKAIESSLAANPL